jgi:hypothetical protein
MKHLEHVWAEQRCGIFWGFWFPFTEWAQRMCAWNFYHMNTELSARIVRISFMCFVRPLALIHWGSNIANHGKVAACDSNSERVREEVEWKIVIIHKWAMNSSKHRTLSSGGCRAESIQIKRDRMEALEMQLRNLVPNAIKSKTCEP